MGTNDTRWRSGITVAHADAVSDGEPARQAAELAPDSADTLSAVAAFPRQSLLPWQHSPEPRILGKLL